MSFVESPERLALRAAVSDLAHSYGWQYTRERARAGEHLTELWQEAGKAGFLGVMLFGMEKVGRKLHFAATCMVAVGTSWKKIQPNRITPVAAITAFLPMAVR